jgi:hypothetical protein
MEKAEARNAEELDQLWNKMAREDWLAGEGFSGKYDGLSKVPHIFKRRIFEFAESYASLREAQAWISVKDRLPESTNPVLGGCAGFKGLFICVYTKGHEIEYGDEDYDGPYDEIEDKNGTLYLKPGWYELEEQIQSQYDEAWLNRHITHWQPLPQPPDHENR